MVSRRANRKFAACDPRRIGSFDCENCIGKEPEMELGTSFWIISGSFVAVFLGSVVVEQCMLFRKYRRSQEKASESEPETPQAAAPE